MSIHYTSTDNVFNDNIGNLLSKGDDRPSCTYVDQTVNISCTDLSIPNKNYQNCRQKIKKAIN